MNSGEKEWILRISVAYESCVSIEHRSLFDVKYKPAYRFLNLFAHLFVPQMDFSEVSIIVWLKAEHNKWNLSQQNVNNIPPSWTRNALQMFKKCKLQRIDSINNCCGGKQIKIMLQVFSTASRQQWFASMSCSFVLHWSNYCHPVVPGCKLAFGDLKNSQTELQNVYQVYKHWPVCALLKSKSKTMYKANLLFNSPVFLLHYRHFFVKAVYF